MFANRAFIRCAKIRKYRLDERLPLDLLKIKNQPNSHAFTLQYFPLFIQNRREDGGTLESQSKEVDAWKKRFV